MKHSHRGIVRINLDRFGFFGCLGKAKTMINSNIGMSNREIREAIVSKLEQLKKHIAATYSQDILRKLSVEDIAHETIARAFSAIENFEYQGEAKLFSWLKQIARHYTISVIKRASSNEKPIISELLIDSGLFSPSSNVRRKELCETINSSVEQLDNTNREVLKLRYEGGHSFVQIADILGITDAAVRGRHRNALQKLSLLVRAKGMMSSIKRMRTNS